MTKYDFLQSVLLEKDTLTKNSITLYQLGGSTNLKECLESIEILTVYTGYLSKIIVDGIIDGDAEKLP